MKKICILTSVHSAFDVRIFHKEAKTLAEKNYEVVLIAQHPKDEIIDKIKIIALPKQKSRWKKILKTDFLLYEKALRQKADVYHFHDPELILWALKLKNKTGAKIIYDAHEDVPKDILSKNWIPKFIRFTVAKLFDMLEKTVSKKFDYIVTATPGIKDNFKKHRVIDIKNYPIVKVLKFSENFLFPKNGKYYNIIYAGGPWRIRGIKETIQSLKFVKTQYGVRLTLIGKFSEKEFEKEVKNLEEWNKVDFWGWLPPEELNKHLLMADIGVVCFLPEPNHISAMPNKIFEYMAAGLPIIASDFPLWKKIIEENNCGICVNPLNPKEIAKAVEYLIEHPDETKQMGKNGRKAVLEKYNWENESKKLLMIYEKLCAE
ncbi:MAG: glycosyltransferase family 4 protein [Patescibacteria group bacterium]